MMQQRQTVFYCRDCDQNIYSAPSRDSPASQIENQLLSDAKATRTDSGIRNTVADLPGATGTQTVDKGTFLRELLDAPASTRNAEIARVTVPGA